MRGDGENKAKEKVINQTRTEIKKDERGRRRKNINFYNLVALSSSLLFVVKSKDSIWNPPKTLLHTTYNICYIIITSNIRVMVDSLCLFGLGFGFRIQNPVFIINYISEDQFPLPQIIYTQILSGIRLL